MDSIDSPIFIPFGGWVDSIDSPIPHSIKCSSRASDTQLLHLEDGFPPKKAADLKPISNIGISVQEDHLPKRLSFFPKCRITTSTARASAWISTHFWDIHNGVGYVSIIYILYMPGSRMVIPPLLGILMMGI